MTPSNANTSGLIAEIDAEMEGRQRGYADVRGELLFRCRDALVTAASAQARIAELESERDDVSALRKAIFRVILNEGGVMVAPGEEPDAIRRIIARATAAEARADRLADIVKLLDECIWLNPDTQNFEVNHDGSVEKARAALQQETQP